jgi:CRISPR type I-F-associated protein Csy3
MSKKSKSEAPAHVGGTVYAVVGSFAPTDFRFHQAGADEVAKLVAKEEGVAPFRRLPSVVLRSHQGYVGTNAVALTEKDRSDEKKLAERRATNPGTRDVASLDADKDTLVVIGSIKFVANYFEPQRFDNPAMAAYQREFVTSYIADGQYPVLILRYLSNLVNGTALWRNRYGFTRKTVVTLRAPGLATRHFVIDDESSADFAYLVADVAMLTKTKGAYVQLEIAMIVELGFDAEVYPSQPFISGDAKTALRKVPKDNNYGRVLATRIDADGKEQVILTSNKVGNALRRVDYGYADEVEAPIAVELYGTVATERVAHRLDARTDYFSLVTSKTYETMTPEERHYIMSVFIKGGLLNFAKEEKAAKGDDE